MFQKGDIVRRKTEHLDTYNWRKWREVRGVDPHGDFEVHSASTESISINVGFFTAKFFELSHKFTIEECF
jgi:hypothetical protein